MNELNERSCQPCNAATPCVSESDAQAFLLQLPGWALGSKDGIAEISKTYPFADYHATMAFVNATAWVSHMEDHHPDLEVSYNRCRVRYSTHAIGGLSENDFICAAKIERVSKATG
jgi:4a-hydroxytetrahydrobiopterin dehydratase